MKKSLIALAALAATGAFAQSTVTIYGRAHVAYDAQYSATGSVLGAAGDVKNRRRVADDGSRVGLRITEDLGGGLRAFSVIETGINLDSTNAGTPADGAAGNGTSGGQSGVFNTGTGYFGSREAHVGIGNATAELRLGRQNVWWGMGPIEDVGANRISGGVGGSYSAASSGWLGAPAARMENTVQVIAGSATGGFAGSSIWFAHPNAAEKTGVGADAKAAAQGFTLRYITGPFAAQYDYGVNKNTFNDLTSTSNVDNKGAKLGLAYTYAPGSKAYFVNTAFSRDYSVEATNATALSVTAAGALAGGKRKQSSNQIGVQHRMGALELHAQYVTQGNVKGYSAELADSGSKAYALGARYELSKRTAITGSYNIINNGKANNMNISGGGQSSVGSLTAGSDLKVMRASIQHQF